MTGRRGMRRVALLVETSNGYARGLLRGVIDYARDHGHWSVYLGEHGRGDEPPRWLARWDGDGIIARIENERIARAVTRSGRPVVDVSAARLLPELPWVETDDRAIAQQAAEHLLERGIRHFAYFGDERFNWSNWRQEHFCELLEKQGFDCAVYSASAASKRDWEHEEDELADWLAGLPKPVGVMACYDIAGRVVLDACRRARVKVPDEVAVVGVDNDGLVCELSDPPLSSVQPDSRRTGYTAASLLDRMMRGRRVKKLSYRIPPLGVVTRQSSSVLAVTDQDVAEAVRYIRDHACDGINVKDVLQRVPLSRRALEARFVKAVGRTPHAEVERVRLERVRHLLLVTDLSIAEVARRTGFRHQEYLSVAFRRYTGQSPTAFRSEARAGA
ncbi:MAG TPA: DNA-binding transcriptional regulator [Tepidisphaeraceae bacterium]|nr:DNA-binding transcriptional regulator [Tepidisphaeraceae bacterium]